jgi:hypothetical protein
VAVTHALLPLAANTYQPHALHRGERSWSETNCYVDLWIEVAHAFGRDPHAALPFTVALDFEGDQWLFFKQPTSDLAELYGFDVQELNIWRDLLEHVVEQLGRGRLVLVEVDAFHLPDTAGVSYHTAHSKTTIGIQRIDLEQRTLGYFHNASYFELTGDDFNALFGLSRSRANDELPPYTEFVKIDRDHMLGQDELLGRSLRLLRHHLKRRPSENPVARFRERFQQDLTWLVTRPPETFHQYAFSTVRQLGACYELSASYTRWLGTLGQSGLNEATAAFDTLATQAKTLQFKAARAVMLQRPVDFAPMFDPMEAAWETALGALERLYLPGAVSSSCPAAE